MEWILSDFHHAFHEFHIKYSRNEMLAHGKHMFWLSEAEVTGRRKTKHLIFHILKMEFSTDFLHYDGVIFMLLNIHEFLDLSMICLFGKIPFFFCRHFVRHVCVGVWMCSRVEKLFFLVFRYCARGVKVIISKWMEKASPSWFTTEKCLDIAAIKCGE